MDTLIPPRQPSIGGTSSANKPRMLNVKLGDGYKVDAPDGVNPVERSQTLSWDPIRPDEAQAIVDFLDAHVGKPFYYRLPRELAPRAWVCVSINRSHPYPNNDALSISLEERYIW